MSQSTARRSARKDRPKKPYPEFPLSPHASGKWQKKIGGKLYYFGRWANVVNGKLVRIDGDGWKEALEVYNTQVHDIRAGRKPEAAGGRLTVRDLCNHFLTAKTRKVEAGEIGQRAFNEYRETTDLLVRQFGVNTAVETLTAADFATLRATMAKRWGPTRSIRIPMYRVAWGMKARKVKNGKG